MKVIDSGTDGDTALSKSSSESDKSALRTRTRGKKVQQPSLGIVIVSAGDEGRDEASAVTDEYARFISRLKPRERAELRELEAHVMRFDEDKQPIRYRILRSAMPQDVKYSALTCLNTLETMHTDDAEFHKRMEYINRLCTIPFGKFLELPVSRGDAAYKVHRYLLDVRRTMDGELYGMSGVKDSIVELIGQSITNPGGVCNAIGLHGDYGVGKTEFVKNAVAKVLGRPFHLIGLGGSSHSSSLIGHEYTYSSARWGVLADILMRSRTLSCVIFFDELDKVSDTPQGEEITGLLTHLIDPAQNTCIKDRYFQNVPLDFSHCMFFFSFNDRSKVDPVLLDRIKTLRVDGYKVREKVAIARGYMLPKLFANIGLDPDSVILTDHDIQYVIDKYCPDEPGMRSLKKLLEALLLRINAVLLTSTKRCDPMFKIHLGAVPVILHRDLIDAILVEQRKELEEGSNKPPWGMYA
jgi:ATP-dependent Lon protease